MQERLLEIQNQSLGPSPTFTQYILDKINSEITGYILTVERRRRKLYININPYSQTLSKSWWKIQ